MAFDPDEYGNPIEDFIDSTYDWYNILPSMGSIGPRPSTANAAWRAWNRGQRTNCNDSGGYYAGGACLLGQAAVDKATEALNSDLSSISNKGQGWLNNNADNIDAEGNFIGELTEAQINTANDINQTKLEDLEAVAEYTGEDIYTQKANELSVLITTIGNYGTTDDGGDESGGEEGLGELDSNADIRQILKDNGYSDEAIEEIFDADVNNDRFQGNNVLSNALCEIGYSNCSDWSVTAVNPTGDECMNADGEGTYQNGECVTDTSENSICYNVEDGVKVEGKRDANGQCISLGSGGGNEGNEGGGTGVGDECEIQLPFGAGTIKGKYDKHGTCIPLGVGGGDGTGDLCDDPENASLPECVEKSFEDYVKEVGEGVANTAKGLYDELGDKITECVGSPIDCIKKIGTAILGAGGVPSYCTDGSLSDFCTEKGPDEGGPPCWKDCVDFNTPGLPLPNIPLPPGVVDIGTYRDFENAIKTVGHTIGDIIDGKEACGPNGKQECTVGQVLEDLGTWAKEKWEEAISGIDDATADDVLDWLKGVLGSVTAGIIWAEIEEEVTNILTSYDTSDDGKCIERGYFENNQEKCEALGYVDCDTLTEGETQLTGGIQKGEENCSEVVDPNVDENGCTDGTWNENMQQCMCSDGVTPEDADGKCEDDSTGTPEEVCQEKNLTYNPDDPTADEDGCVDDSTTTTEYTPVCPDGRPTGAMTFELEDQQYMWDEACKSTHCPDGSSLSANPDCYGEDNNGNGTTTKCDNNAVAPDCVQCPNFTTIPAWHEDGDCSKPYLDSGKPCGENGEVYNDAGECVSQETGCDDPNSESDGQGGCQCKANFIPDPETGVCLTLNDYCRDYPDDELCSTTTGGCPDGSEPQYNINDTDKDGVVKVSGMWFKYDPCDPEGSSTEVFPCPDGSFVEDRNDCGTTQICDNPYATNDGQEGECVFNDCANGAIDPENNCVTCPDGNPPVNGQCVTVTEPCQPRGTVLESGCDGTTFFIRFASGEIDPNTGECGEIYDSVPDFHECVGNGGGICNDPNAVNYGEEGDCRCKPGFSKDPETLLCVKGTPGCDNGATVESGCDTCPDGTSVIEYEDGQCPTTTECNDCTCAAYAAANPEECAPPPPPPPPPPPSSGGVDGGGGMGAFSPFIAGIDYTPQPLPAAPAAPQKDYMAELDSLIKRSLFEGKV
jgi:hypothetical protein